MVRADRSTRSRGDSSPRGSSRVLEVLTRTWAPGAIRDCASGRHHLPGRGGDDAMGGRAGLEGTRLLHGGARGPSLRRAGHARRSMRARRSGAITGRRSRHVLRHQAMAAQCITMKYDAVHTVLGESEFVLCRERGRVRRRPHVVLRPVPRAGRDDRQALGHDRDHSAAPDVEEPEREVRRHRVPCEHTLCYAGSS